MDDNTLTKLHDLTFNAILYSTDETISVKDRLDYLMFIRKVLNSYQEYENCKRVLNEDYEENHKWEDKRK